MKFVLKDSGEASENSSGGGIEGVLRELLYMFIAYWGMIFGVFGSGLVIIVLVVWFFSV